MVGPVAASVAATVGGGVGWLSAGRRPFAQSASDSRSGLAPRRAANDAGRPGENWVCLSLILATGYPPREEAGNGNLIVARRWMTLGWIATRRCVGAPTHVACVIQRQSQETQNGEKPCSDPAMTPLRPGRHLHRPGPKGPLPALARLSPRQRAPRGATPERSTPLVRCSNRRTELGSPP